MNPKLFALVFIGLLAISPIFMNCSGSGFATTANIPFTIAQTPESLQGYNIVPINVGLGASLNAVVASVKICVPGTTTCQVVDNLLVDSGSTGLRIFASAVGNGPVLQGITGAANGEGSGIYNCTYYADSTFDWGIVASADVTLGQEVASNVPIQIIDDGAASGDNSKPCVNVIQAAYAAENASGTPIPDVASTGYSGILGVRFETQDCGAFCVTNENNNQYFSCAPASSCQPTTVDLSQQLANPVSLLQYDNNGVVESFPVMDGLGGYSLAGQMYLGVGTQPNNTPPNTVNVVVADPNEFDSSGNANPNYEQFTTSFQGQSMRGFIDSGSGCFTFPSNSPSLNPTPTTGGSYFEPTNPVSLNANLIDYFGNQATVSFSVANINQYNVQPYCAESLNTGLETQTFLWGFPFFVGRKVYIGLEGQYSNIGSGFYWAF